MYSSHKEKERIRHQKQVKLLNQVMEHVPKVSKGPQTKVRKLRRLILYTHYLRMVHSEITKNYEKIDDCENFAMDKDKDLVSDKRKSPSKLIKNLRHKRANIVFLQADKSLNSTRKTQKNNLLDVNSQCTSEEYTALPTGYDYKMPEPVPQRNAKKIRFDPEDTCISENTYHSQIDMENYVFSQDQAASKSESLDVNKQAFKNLESSSFIKSFSDNDKGSYMPVFNSHVPDDELTEKISPYEDSSISLFTNDEAPIIKHKPVDFPVNLLQNYNILKESKFLNSENKSNNYSNLTLDKNQESLLNSLDADHFQNFSSDNGFSNLSNECPITNPYRNNFFNSDFHLNFASKILSRNDMSLLAKNASNDSSCYPSNDKISIDVENMSDSNSSSDSSNSAQYNVHDTYPDSGHSNFKISEDQNYPINEPMVYGPMGIGYAALSMHPQNYACLDKNILRSDNTFKAMYGVPYSYINSVYPPSIAFNKRAFGVPFFTESNSESYKKWENKNYVESDSFYSPFFNDSFPKEEFSLIQPKLEVDDATYTHEYLYKENVKPSFFEEEASYPLSQYFSIDK